MGISTSEMLKEPTLMKLPKSCNTTTIAVNMANPTIFLIFLSDMNKTSCCRSGVPDATQI